MTTGVVRMDNYSAGEVGGVFAGIVTVIGLLGGAVRWVFGWTERRAELRHAKLQAWEDSLARREREQRVELEREISELRSESRAKNERLQAVERDQKTLHQMWQDARGVLLDVTIDLHLHAPQSSALVRAVRVLRRQYEGYEDAPQLALPPELLERLERLDDLKT